MASQEWTILLWQWTAGLLCCCYAVGGSACPDNALQKVQEECTSQLMPAGGFLEKAYIQRTMQACRQHKLLEAVDCVENITLACQGNTDQEHFLRRLIDAKKMRAFFQYFCSHLEDYQLHAPCIENAHLNMSQCVDQQRETMMTKVKATPNMDYHVISTCKYMQAALLCSQILSNICGQAAVQLIDRIFRAFEPPVCRDLPDMAQPRDHHPVSSDSVSLAADVSLSGRRPWVGITTLAAVLMTSFV